VNKLHLMAITAGICFGTWPLFLMRSGLRGNVASWVYGLGGTFLFTLAVFVPLVMRGTVSQAFEKFNWWPYACAVLIGMPGLLLFNTMLAKAGPKEAGQLFVLMILVQTSIPAIYHIYQNGNVSLSKIIGFSAAILAAILLTRR
jgi:hypothetical protein